MLIEVALQFQKPDPVTDSYRLAIQVKDGVGNQVGSTGEEQAPSGRVIPVKSPLPSVLTVAAQNVDDDPLLFTFGGLSFSSDGPECKVGKYDSGNRDMDCGFPCPV